MDVRITHLMLYCDFSSLNSCVVYKHELFTLSLIGPTIDSSDNSVCIQLAQRSAAIFSSVQVHY